MCGLAGILDARHPVSGVVLRRMGSAIAHRGPDGEGEYVESAFGVAHRRLAILDLTSAGHQPMLSADGRYVLAYNGEVYNFETLRLELQSLGYQFRSRSDTEVVLNALAAWGTDALGRFNGMFALALWDRHERSLLLARDRYGVKPLYVLERAERLVFASEIKALLCHGSVSAEMDAEALVEYVTFQNFFSDRTLFKGIRILKPGHWLRARADSGALQTEVRRYWDFQFEEPTTLATEEEYEEELDRLFRQAVGRQLVSDVDLGAYLSGGLDSGSITALTAQQIPCHKSFTVGFDLHSASGLELAFDERERAEHMSYLFRTEHYEMVLKAGDMERCMPRLAWHVEEPRVGQSYPNFYAAQLAGKFVKVVLSGVGGDEIFGGYPWRYFHPSSSSGAAEFVDRYYAFWQRVVDNQVLPSLLGPLWPEVGHVDPRQIFEGVLRDHPGQGSRPEDFLNQSLYFEAKTFLHGLLVVEDKLSMAHGLETRVPFLDNDLVDFAQRLPARMKVHDLGRTLRVDENEPGDKSGRYFRQTRDGKRLLRRVMTRYVPLSVTSAVKQGFSAPDASWFKGDSMDYVRRMLFGRGVCIYDFLDRKTTQALVQDHLDGRANRRLLIWSLLSLEQWCRQFANPTAARPFGGARP